VASQAARAGRPLQPVPRLLLSRKEAAAALGVSVDTFERRVQPVIKLVPCGQLLLVPVKELERWCEEHAHYMAGGDVGGAVSLPPSGPSATTGFVPWQRTKHPGVYIRHKKPLPCVRDSGRPVQVQAVIQRVAPTPGDREDRLEPELRRYQRGAVVVCRGWREGQARLAGAHRTGPDRSCSSPISGGRASSAARLEWRRGKRGYSSTTLRGLRPLAAPRAAPGVRLRPGPLEIRRAGVAVCSSTRWHGTGSRARGSRTTWPWFARSTPGRAGRRAGSARESDDRGRAAAGR